MISGLFIFPIMACLGSLIFLLRGFRARSDRAQRRTSFAVSLSFLVLGGIDLIPFSPPIGPGRLFPQDFPLIVQVVVLGGYALLFGWIIIEIVLLARHVS